MTESGNPGRVRELDIDWARARSELRSRIQTRLGSGSESEIEDLTQQALVDVLRMVRKQGLRDLQAVIVIVARSTAVDEIRRRVRWRARFEELDPGPREAREPGDPGHDHDDDLELLWFLLLESLRSRHAPCHALAVSFAKRGNWRSVGEALGLSHAAVRQQWSRCLRAFREALRKDPGPFREWIGHD